MSGTASFARFNTCASPPADLYNGERPARHSSFLSTAVAVYALAGWELVLRLVLHFAGALQACFLSYRQQLSLSRLSVPGPTSNHTGIPRGLPLCLTPIPRPISSAAARRGASLLPPPRPGHGSRLTVVLDLDETLLCTYTLDQLPAQLRNQPSCWVQYGSPGNPSTTVAVFQRPGVADFLHRASAFAELVLFTAASAAYARPLGNLLDPTGAFFGGRRLYKDATVRVCGKSGVKDLSALGRDLSRVVLVDNNPFCFLLQPGNGLPCQPYHATKTDSQLLDVLLPLLAILADTPDIRPVLEARFGMAGWFRGRGYPVP